MKCADFVRLAVKLGQLCLLVICFDLINDAISLSCLYFLNVSEFMKQNKKKI